MSPGSARVRAVAAPCVSVRPLGPVCSGLIEALSKTFHEIQVICRIVDGSSRLLSDDSVFSRRTAVAKTGHGLPVTSLHAYLS